MLAALVGSASCVLLGARARARLLECAPPKADELLDRARAESGRSAATAAELGAEMELLARDASARMAVLSLRSRLLSRVALALGTGSAVLALGGALGGEIRRGLALAAGCFLSGVTAALLCAELGRSASVLRARFRDGWNARRSEVRQRLGENP